MPTATVTLLPTSQGTHSAFSDGAGTVPTSMQTEDGSTTYRELGAGAGTGKDTYNVDNMPPAGVIEKVTLKGSMRRGGAGAGTTTLMHRYSSTDANGADRTIDISYILYSDIVATNAAGGAWTQAVLDATEVGFNKTVGAASATLCTYSAIEVDYIPPAGGFAYLLNSFIGAAICLADIPGIIETFRISTGGKHLIHPNECWRVFRDLKEAKNVSYQFQ